MERTINLQKKSTAERYFMSLAVVLTSLFASVAAFAQSVPEKVDVNISTEGGSVWYGQPWIWAVGVAVFIVIIVAITRNRSDK